MAGRALALALAMGSTVPASAVVLNTGAASAGTARSADTALDRALARFVRHADGPPGVAVVVQRGDRAVLHQAGTADLATGAPIRAFESMRLASVAKAFSGAVALSLVAGGRLSPSDTVGQRLPGLPHAWARVTLRELLQHTSGIPDFSQTRAFQKALLKSLLKAPPAASSAVLRPKKLNFPRGSRYEYSNSDNIIVALMAEAATGQSYEKELQQRVFAPLGLDHTSLPRGAQLPPPFVHGYNIAPPHPPADVTSVIAAGWAWASGGIVSTPNDANTFIRVLRPRRHHQPRGPPRTVHVPPGNSEPPGPGQNSAGLAIFRYQTRCGTVYGHTGNTLGYTQFVAASANGRRSVVVSVNSQITPAIHPDRSRELRHIYTLAVCAALAQ